MAISKPVFAKEKTTVTPAGVAGFPWLTKADFQFDEGGKYKTNLIFNADDPGLAALKKKIAPIHKAAKTAVLATGTKEGKITMVSPFKPETDESGNDTGRIMISAHTTATQKVGDKNVNVNLTIVDSRKKALAESTPVYGGSVLKLAVRPAPYFMQGNLGITFYLSAVQVIELASGGDAASLFDEEEGGFENEETPADSFDSTDADVDPGADDADFY